MITQLSIWLQAIIVFITFFSFILARTSNVIYTADRNITGALVSGAFVHLLWLVSVGLGVNAVIHLSSHYPVLLGSLSGSLLGTYVAIKRKQNDKLNRY
jgi:hypothetical protein